MNQSEGELFCDLDALEPEERRVIAATEQRLKGEVTSMEELSDGLVFEFPGDREVLEIIGKWLPLETACCPFLHFALEVPAGEAPIRLSMTGGHGVKGFLMQELGWL